MLRVKFGTLSGYQCIMLRVESRTKRTRWNKKQKGTPVAKGKIRHSMPIGTYCVDKRCIFVELHQVGQMRPAGFRL